MASVLLIDDSKTVRQYNKFILAAEGYGVDEAENGMEALEKVLDKQYDLFVIDINMPVMDGYTFLEEIRKNPDYQNIPMIMVSTEADDIDRINAYKAGADLYYIKPVKQEELLLSASILTAQ